MKHFFFPEWIKNTLKPNIRQGVLGKCDRELKNQVNILKG